MSEQLKDFEVYKNKIEELNSKLIDLTQELQKEVKELKEDTILNAQHINVLKTKTEKTTTTINDKVTEHISDVGIMSSALAEVEEEKEQYNYLDFLHTLLDSDFEAKQKTLLEQSKRELLESKGGGGKSSGGSNGGFFSMLCNFLGLISFVLLIYIVLKYKLLF